MPRNTQVDKKTHKEVTQWILVAPGTSFTCILEKKNSIRRIEVVIDLTTDTRSHELSGSFLIFTEIEFISLLFLILRSLVLKFKSQFILSMFVPNVQKVLFVLKNVVKQNLCSSRFHIQGQVRYTVLSLITVLLYYCGPG